MTTPIGAQNSNVPAPSTQKITVLPDMAQAVQTVIDKNNRTELALLSGTGLLFLMGLASVGAALVQGQFFWTLPSAAISVALYWPIRRIEVLRNRNIAIAASAALISTLPPAAAAREIQKLLEKLFVEDPN